jgi:hypothetical protein
MFSDSAEIQALEAQLSDLIATNANLRANCERLEQELASITSAANCNLTLLETMNSEVEQANATLRIDIEARSTLLEQIKPVYQRFDPSEIQIDSVRLKKFLRWTKKHLSPVIGLDPIVVRIVQQYPYFTECRTNSDFITCVRKLMFEVQNRTSKSAWEEQRRRRRIEHLNKKEAVEMAVCTKELTRLAADFEALGSASRAIN